MCIRKLRLSAYALALQPPEQRPLRGALKTYVKLEFGVKEADALRLLKLAAALIETDSKSIPSDEVQSAN